MGPLPPRDEPLSDKLLQLELALKAARIGVWECDIVTGQVHWAAEHAALFGIAAEEFAGTLDAVQTFVHPEDRDHGMEAIGRTLEQGVDFDNLYRVIWPDGSIHCLHSLGRLTNDANGERRRLVGVTWDITEQREAEDQMAALAALVKHSDAIIVMKDPDLRVIAANPAFARVAGYASEKELIGKTDAEIFQIPPDKEPVRSYMADERAAQLLSPGEMIVREESVWAQDGEQYWYLTKKYPIHDPSGRLIGTANISVDITQRRALERQMFGTSNALRIASAESQELAARSAAQARRLQQLNEEQRALFDAATSGIAVLRKRVLHNCNRQLHEMFGYPMGALEGQSTRLLYLDDESWRDIAEHKYPRLRSGEIVTQELQMRRRDGSAFWVRFSARIITSDDPDTAVMVADDISAQRAALEEVQRAQAQAEAAARAKSDFLANMSHEIRTPMNAVLGLAYLLTRQDLPAEAQQLARKIQTSGQSLLGIINDILDVSKIESGKIDLERIPFQISQVLDNLATIMAANARDKAIELRMVPPACADWRLQGDPLRLGQILINLANNAIKFTDAGVVEVRVEVIASTAAEVRLRFAVRDTGIGIDAETQARLFQPFVQADASTHRRFGGSGLGLVIVHRLVGLMGGEMGLDSVPGEGSTFWFEVPFAVLDCEQGADSASPSTGTLSTTGAEVDHTQHLTALRLLVVDDNEINREVARGIFLDEGARVSVANDGRQALDWLVAHADDIDIVLMDVQMPVMDGLEATRAIRKHPKLVKLPVIALTAGIMPEQQAAAREAGVDAFLSKPFNVEDAVALIGGFSGRTVEIKPLETNPDTSQATTAAEYPGLNLAQALAIWKDNARYCLYLRKFADEQAAGAERIAASAPDQARRLAHTIKGAAGNLGLDEVAACASDLERHYRTQAGEDATAPAIAALQAALATAVDSIARYSTLTANQNPDSAEREPLDLKTLTTLIRAAYNAFADFEPHLAEEPLGELARALSAEQLAPLNLAFENLDAGAGAAATQALAAELGIGLEKSARVG